MTSGQQIIKALARKDESAQEAARNLVRDAFIQAACQISPDKQFIYVLGLTSGIFCAVAVMFQGKSAERLAALDEYKLLSEELLNKYC